MGFLAKYREIRQSLREGKTIWNPETKVVVLPSGIIVWLGGRLDSPPIAIKLMWDDRCPVDHAVLARFAAKGVLPKGTIIVPAEPEDVTGGSPEAALEVLREVPEPYRSKLVAWLLPMT